MVKHYIGNSTHTAMAGDGHDWKREFVDQVGINGNQTLGAAADQHARILLDQVGPVPVVGDEVEIVFLEQPVSDTSHHFRVIAVGQYGHQDANGHGATISQGAGKETGLVVEFDRCLANSLPGSFRDGAPGYFIQDDRYGGRVEIQVSGEGLEADTCVSLAAIVHALAHETYRVLAVSTKIAAATHVDNSLSRYLPERAQRPGPL